MLECSICEEEFDSSLRIPLNLMCHHTYCSKCLGNINNKNNEENNKSNKNLIECPKCRSQTAIPNQGIDYLPKNWSIFEALQQDQNLLCEHHKIKVKFYCQLCSTLICPNCLIDRHKKHDFITSNEAYLQHKLQSPILIQRANKLANDAETIVNKSKEIQENSKFVIEKLKENMKNHFAMLQTALQKRETELFHQLNWYENKINQWINFLQQECTLITDYLPPKINDLSSSLKNNQELSVILRSQELSKEVKLQEKKKIFASPLQDPLIEFNSYPEIFFKEIQASYLTFAEKDLRLICNLSESSRISNWLGLFRSHFVKGDEIWNHFETKGGSPTKRKNQILLLPSPLFLLLSLLLLLLLLLPLLLPLLLLFFLIFLFLLPLRSLLHHLHLHLHLHLHQILPRKHLCYCIRMFILLYLLDQNQRDARVFFLLIPMSSYFK